MAGLRSIALTGFDQPLTLSCLSLDAHPTTSTSTSTSTSDSQTTSDPSKLIPTASRMDHPKLTAAGHYFLKGVDLSIPEMAHELAFADALATRSNPTTADNIHRKLTVLPEQYFGFSKEQQDAYYKLVDFAEMKQALRLELRLHEKLIREQELKYLTTDYGLGNVVHGWDISGGGGGFGGGGGGLTERQASSTRLATRRKVKDSDRIFSSSSVMSSLTTSRMTKPKRIDSVKKKKKNREKIEKERKKQQSLQKRRMNIFREETSIDTEESFAGDETFTISGRDSDDDEAHLKKVTTTKKKHQPQQPTPFHHQHHQNSTLKKAASNAHVKKPSNDFFSNSSGRLSNPMTAPKTIQHSSSKFPATVQRQDSKPASESGHRLRTLLTNRTPHTAAAAVSSSPLDSGNTNSPVGASASHHQPLKEPLKIKIMKYKAPDAIASPAAVMGIFDGGGSIPASPAQSVVTVDSGSETPDAVSSSGGGTGKRNRGRPKRLAD
ncbi:hypothetical protein BV898_01960 [Hypsibius exemplaris]|uniref:Chromatin modification-related protein MEAF6 n=1 Tax=Hypsibius exemplaris TaxID=2072580 RepID=A0A1W0X9L0_HYPEX|nr:hypothetical protein BV898_01960 [Hypsibius exemplaris]